MFPVTAPLPHVSANSIERFLAALLVGLLGTYALGTATSGVVPPLEIAGVVAIHLAVIVAGVFPLVVLGRSVSSRVRSGATAGRRLESVVSAGALVCLVSGLWLSLDASSDLSGVLLGCALVALFALIGLVARR
ncbi:hypothetical protein ACOZ4B_01105 (plasmid) [Haloferax prahovense]|uniref:hypothetical protein n=1 Tax=Haloferax TaxID=2251 RepID=UPI000737D2CB|nr:MULTISPECIES: hypothetical protein [unclassified Haloferax]MCO8267001.1 hypothetical protein [Haloferax sp. AB510]